VKLAERLQLATDPDKRFLTIQQAFEEVIRVDRNFSLILHDIKQAYDEKVYNNNNNVITCKFSLILKRYKIIIIIMS
jgi:uncharacterized protein YutD